MEIATAINAVKYLHKYIHKGHDRAYVSLQADDGWRLWRRFHWTGWKFHLRLGVSYITSCNTKPVGIGISSLR